MPLPLCPDPLHPSGPSGWVPADGVVCTTGNRMKVLWTLLLCAAPVALAEDSTAGVWLGDHSVQVPVVFSRLRDTKKDPDETESLHSRHVLS